MSLSPGERAAPHCSNQKESGQTGTGPLKILVSAPNQALPLNNWLLPFFILFFFF